MRKGRKMNYIEKIVDRKLRRLGWKWMNFDKRRHAEKNEYQISQYKWIIKNSEGVVLYDTERDGYEGLKDFPVVTEALEFIEPVEKKKMGSRKGIVERRIVFTIDSQLHSFFPSKNLEIQCVS